MTYPTAWARIERVSNGWIVSGRDHQPINTQDDETIYEVFTDHEDDRWAASLHQALWAVIGYLCAEGTRYDTERVRIKLEPGDRHEEINNGEPETP